MTFSFAHLTFLWYVLIQTYFTDKIIFGFLLPNSFSKLNKNYLKTTYNRLKLSGFEYVKQLKYCNSSVLNLIVPNIWFNIIKKIGSLIFIYIYYTLFLPWFFYLNNFLNFYFKIKYLIINKILSYKTNNYKRLC